MIFFFYSAVFKVILGYAWEKLEKAAFNNML